jgi:cyclic pyranopterin phosphate synthase
MKVFLKKRVLHIKQLIDSYGRNLYYLRLSITDKCQFSCSYCRTHEMKFLPKEELLTYEEIERLIGLFKDMGTKKIRITGGEPLVRQGIENLLFKIQESGLKTALTTNGFLLEKILPKIKNSVNSINVSLDSVHPLTFQKISGMPPAVMKKVMKAIKVSKESGIPTKINTVALQENFFEINDLIDFSKTISTPIRFIEYMTIKDNDKTVFSFEEVKEKIKKSRGLIEIKNKFGDGPAKYYKTNDGAIVGFISYSEPHFCDKCNRLRITPNGLLRLCLILGNELNLKKMLRAGMKDEDIKEKILSFVKLKPFSHGAYKVLNKNMNKIGG